mmetsp:Transcript_24284/g.30902  ORF Transcript_24284/g.30902 Transcript_24284/m.30902 type:complete len:126 (+) Transcript_24284:1475-1852(+)
MHFGSRRGVKNYSSEEIDKLDTTISSVSESNSFVQSLGKCKKQRIESNASLRSKLWQGPHPFMTGCDPKSARRQRAWDINQAIVALQNANVAEVSRNSIQKAHSPSSPSESRNDSEAQHRTETQS